MRIFTKQDYLNSIYSEVDLFIKAGKTDDWNNIRAKHLNGRHYIPKSTKLKTLENIYEDMINYISDNKLRQQKAPN